MAGALAGSAASARAAVVAADSFAYAPGAVAGNNGGTGFASGYTGSGTVVATGLTYPNLVTSAGALSSPGGNAGAFRTLAATIPDAAGSPTVYFSYLTQGTSTAYSGLSLFHGTTEEVFTGQPFGGGYGYNGNGLGGAAGAPAPASTAAQLLVYSLSFGATTDTLTFYADPAPGQPAPATPTGAITFTPTNANGFDTIRVQGGGGAVLYDEVRFGTTYADVTPAATAVPEPAPLAAAVVAALATGGLVGRRRPVR